MSKDKRKSVKEFNAELELLADCVKKLEEKDASEVPDKVQEKLNSIEEILRSYDKKIGDKQTNKQEFIRIDLEIANYKLRLKKETHHGCLSPECLPATARGTEIFQP